ncbi:hypothetical protein [uncultured Dysosmobacter sp.]|uniref:hypothetical protein n=1 Tax=uncultured Dysosmobacter sp. TaxID=2591384 RepID=UPI002627DA81|nr:hypothetical protein [uncultured Dysosmobacter sp.]
MLIRQSDKTNISFGNFSDPGTLSKSDIYSKELKKKYFNTASFQYIVDNIAEMFGYASGTVTASVVENDIQAVWSDMNSNGKVDEGEISLRFTMNAAMCMYARSSVYGRNFMYLSALKYGRDVVFGIAAHEIGHLIVSNSLDALSYQPVNGKPALVITARANCFWDELCADYLAGAVMAKTVPPLNRECLKRALVGTAGGSSHPDGFWRTYAIEMGYLWGANNPQNVTSSVLLDANGKRQLLQSFFTAYYNGVYARLSAAERAGKTALPNYLTESCNYLIGYC